jgi:hypothetical protein
LLLSRDSFVQFLPIVFAVSSLPQLFSSNHSLKSTMAGFGKAYSEANSSMLWQLSITAIRGISWTAFIVFEGKVNSGLRLQGRRTVEFPLMSHQSGHGV